MPDRYQSQTNSPVSVVIGGANFLGFEVVRSLIKKGSRVIVIDDQDPKDQQNFKHLSSEPNITYIRQPIDAPYEIKTSVDYVFYLKSLSLKAGYQITKLTEGLKLAINLSRQNKAKFLLANSHIDNIPNRQSGSETSLSQIQKFVNEASDVVVRNFDNLDSRIVNLHHLYGPGQSSITQNQVATLFSDLSDNAVLLAQDGTQLVSPLFISDAAEAVIYSMFTPSTRSKIFNYSGQTTQTLINFAFLIQRLYEASVGEKLVIKNFAIKNSKVIDTTPVAQQTSPNEGFPKTLDWVRKNLEKSFSQVASETLKQKLVVRRQPKQKIKKPPKQSTRIYFGSKRGIIVAFFLAIVVFIYPFVASLFLTNSINKSINQRQFTKTSVQSSKALIQLTRIKSRIRLLSPIIDIFSPNSSQNLVKSIKVGESILQAVESSSRAAVDGSQAIAITIGQTLDDPFPLFDSTNAHLSKAFQEFSLAQSTLEAIDLKALPIQRLIKALELLSFQLPTIRDQVITAQKITSIMPQLLGREESKTYFVLLQNSAELRATGGFIGSFALITFDKGKLLDIETHDVYTADGQLRGHVEPPPPIKTYLGEANWYLRDVNWDPHFPTSARQAEWFLNKEMSRQVDGTIAINLYVIESLLDAFGPLTLADYDETITSSNLFQRAEFHSEVNYFEGSTQKRDFLASLINSLHSQIVSSDQGVTEGLLVSLFNNATQSHFQASFRDKQIETVFSDLGFNGGQLQPKCPITIKSSSCLADYLSIIESNLGVNKVNYFIGRSISHQVSLTPQNTQETLSLTLTNNATSNAWPAGAYKSYIRVYTPQTSTLNTIKVNGEEISTEDITISRKNQKTIFGFFVQIPINSQSIIIVDYNLNQVALNQDTIAYNFLYEKQSGTGPDKLDIAVLYPEEYSLIRSSPEGNSSQNQVDYTSDTVVDRAFLLELTK